MSWIILTVAFAEACLLAWAVRKHIDDPRNTALLLSLAIVVPVCLDATTIATGRWIGFGETLETLSRIRFAWFVFSMPLMWAICAAILANAGFAWARHRAIVPALIVAAVIFGGYEAVGAWRQDFHPACVFDIRRYVLQVPAGQACMGSQSGDGTFGLPLIVPLGTLAVAITGLLLVWKHRWPWLAIICAVLIGVVASPQNAYTTFLSYPTDGLLTATLVWAAVRFYEPEPRAVRA